MWRLIAQKALKFPLKNDKMAIDFCPMLQAFVNSALDSQFQLTGIRLNTAHKSRISHMDISELLGTARKPD